MKIRYKTTILITGMYKLENFEIDNFILKEEKFNEYVSQDEKNYSFYAYGPIMYSAYNKDSTKNIYYQVLEGKSYIQVNYSSSESIENTIEEILQSEKIKIKNLEKKLRLISGLGTTLPIFYIKVIDSKNHVYNRGYVSPYFSKLSPTFYKSDMIKKIADRFKLSIQSDILNSMLEKNQNFNRALDFYAESFNPENIGIRFTLLIVALEALFNVGNENISDSISKYSSALLYLSSNKSRSAKYNFKHFYDLRSRFIHGDESSITQEEELSLREYTREILLIYWIISFHHHIDDNEMMKDFIITHKRSDLAFPVQIYIKYLRTNPENYPQLFEAITEALQEGVTDIFSDRKINSIN